MIYRTFTFEDLPQALWIDNVKNTLKYATSGFVSSYEINNDYLLKNNGSITIVKATQAVSGQIIALIDNFGIVFSGIIRTIDNSNLTITIRNLLGLFDNVVLNPHRAADLTGNVQFDVPPVLYDGINDTAKMLIEFYGGNNNDKWRRLPILIKTNSETSVKAMWKNRDENSFNSLDWILELFNDLNIVIQASLVFEVSRSFIMLEISQKTNDTNYLLKKSKTITSITRQDQTTPTATVCHILNKSSKDVLATYYLTTDNRVTSASDNTSRVQPYRLTVIEYDPNEQKDPPVTLQSLAESVLLYKNFNHNIVVEIDKQRASFLMDLAVGDSITIVTEQIEMHIDDPFMTQEEYKQYIIPSILTGKIESSNNTTIKLLFGKFRSDYTDFIQQNYNKIRR